MMAGEQVPEVKVGAELLTLDLRRGSAGHLLCYGTFELRLILDRLARYPEVETQSAEQRSSQRRTGAWT
jgi:hypothetical protein